MSAGQLGGLITRRSVTPGGRLTLTRHSWRGKSGASGWAPRALPTCFCAFIRETNVQIWCLFLHSCHCGITVDRLHKSSSKEYPLQHESTNTSALAKQPGLMMSSACCLCLRGPCPFHERAMYCHIDPAKHTVFIENIQ